MIFHGLKTNIVIHLTVLLVVAMVLIDFIVITSVQQLLLASTASKGQALLSLLPDMVLHPVNSPSPEKPAPNLTVRKRLNKQDNLICLNILNRDLKPLVAEDEHCPLKSELNQAISESIYSGEKIQHYAGAAWGVFWKQKRWMILSAPIVEDDRVIAAAGLVLPLEPIYVKLRRIQGFILVYIVINTVILTLIGLYGLSQVTIKPLQRLVRRADEYKDEHDLPFIFKKDTSDFSRLSNSLNQMLKRISEDKVKLQETVNRLEQANKDLQTAQRDIIRAEKLATVGRLSSGLAHEIGNPIGIVLGYLELLKQNNLSIEELREYVQRSEDEVNRINGIIGQLLAFSRTTGTDFVQVSVHAVLYDVREVFSLQPIMDNIRMELRLDADDDTVFADSEQLRQVFLNLILNAADAIAAAEDASNGRVLIHTDSVNNPDDPVRQNNRALRIRFIDNGPGIAKDQLGNIFDPFFTTKEPGKGTGLGLSVSYRIIEDIGGTIAADNNSDGGATITIRIPVYNDEDR